MSYLFTSESVSEGHPDKVCDRISDEIVDMIYTETENPSDVRVACEVLATTNKVVLAGEVRIPDSLKKKNGEIDPEQFIYTAIRAIRDIGYEQEGFHWNDCDIEFLIHDQSPDIAQGVDNNGAGDQGIMFGYACKETEEYMPAPIFYAHRILQKLSYARKTGEGDVTLLGPDAKSQVTVCYENGKPVSVDSIVLSTQHLDESWDSDRVRYVVEPIVRNALEGIEISDKCKWFINPTGKFVIGGPDGDTGLTGRKIIVDTYGGAAPHGGGAFSGKDSTKVDRSAAYVSRYLAKNIVSSGVADRCQIQLSYAIGVSDPVSIFVNTFGTGFISDEMIAEAIRNTVDLTPNGIRDLLELNKPIYTSTSSYGHFGRRYEKDGSFSWERINIAEWFNEMIET